MALQNRVDPLGRLIADPARGAWMGNRGQLHDAGRVIRRPWRLKAWLICRLEFRGRYRTVMSPGLYTELFFFDEATALAAGHRPCAECRRSDYNHFKSAAAAGEGVALPKARDMDDRLHAERLTISGAKRTYRSRLSHLPDGAFVLKDGEPWIKWRGRLHLWTPAGYGQRLSLNDEVAEVLTPRLSVEAIRAGYEPQVAL